MSTLTEMRVGKLRWSVFLYDRSQQEDPNSTGIIETSVDARLIHACIEPLHPATFNDAVQVDRPITHMIFIRWVDYIDNSHAILRQTRRPIDGATRTEVFRVHRVAEDDGRKRFLMLECELERIGWTQAAQPITAEDGTVIDSEAGTPLLTEGPAQVVSVTIPALDPSSGAPANTVGAPS